MSIMRSCCCCSMRTGSLIIAVLYMIFTGLILLALGLMLAYFNEGFKPLVAIIIHGLPADQGSYLSSAVTTSVATTQNVMIASMVLKSFYFFLCLLLFVGAVKESSGYLIPWLVADFIRQLLCFASFAFLAWCFGVLVSKKQMDYGCLIVFCVLMLIFIGATFYFWLAVVSASQEFRAREQQVAPEEKKQQSFPHVNKYEMYD